MAENPINSIQIQAYTPSGFRVYVTVAFQNANEIDKLLQENGFMVNVAGAEPGEEVETVTHVALRMKTNDDGTQTPHVAFYLDNEALEWRWAHVYLNNDNDVQDFEDATGLKLASLPVYPADNHPARKPDKMNYIVALKAPIKIARKQIEKSDGTKRNDFTRYVTTNGVPPQIEKVWTREEQATFWNHWTAKGVTKEQILTSLGITSLGEWKHSLASANERMEIKLAS